MCSIAHIFIYRSATTFLQHNVNEIIFYFFKYFTNTTVFTNFNCCIEGISTLDVKLFENKFVFISFIWSDFTGKSSSLYMYHCLFMIYYHIQLLLIDI